jgi:ubiquinone biosynthesis protein COQ9
MMNHPITGIIMQHNEHEQEIAMLRSELEILMKERQSLLQVAGSAAGFIAELSSFDVPKVAMEAAELLAESVNALPEETLQDALTAVQAEIVD